MKFSKNEAKTRLSFLNAAQNAFCFISGYLSRELSFLLRLFPSTLFQRFFFFDGILSSGLLVSQQLQILSDYKKIMCFFSLFLIDVGAITSNKTGRLYHTVLGIS